MLNLEPNSEYAARVQRRLNDERVVWMTTIDQTGTPRSLPVWFLRDGDDLIIYSQPGKPKIRNIERSPRTNLHLNGTVGGGDIIELIGSARVDSATPPASQVPAYVAKYGDDIANIGFTPESFSAEYSVPIRFTPERVAGH